MPVSARQCALRVAGRVRLRRRPGARPAHATVRTNASRRHDRRNRDQPDPQHRTRRTGVAGNTINLDSGEGQFAHYMHLQPESVLVNAGDRVRRGQVLARIGASRDAREPHLHFEVTTSATLLAGEGVPDLIERHRCTSPNGGAIELRIHELPLNKNVVVFGEDQAK